MRVDRIQIENFLGITSLQEERLQAVVLVHGPNGAGKTSLREAIRMAALGAPERVSMVKDYRELIRVGAKTAIISAGFTVKDTIQNVVIQLRDKGEHSGIPTPEKGGKLPMLMSPDYFSSQSHEQRKRTLFALQNVTFTQDRLHDMLREAGADMEMVDELGAVLAAGFRECEKECEARAKEQRRVWTNLTGRKRYGEQIAATWKFETEPVEQTSESLQEIVDRKTYELGNAESVMAQSRRWQEYQRRLTEDVEKLRTKAATFDKYKTSEAGYRDEVAKLSQRQHEIKDFLKNEKPTASQKCPYCKQPLMLNDKHKIIRYKVSVDGVDKIPSYEKELKRIEEDILRLRGQVVSSNRLKDEARDAQVQLETIESMEPPAEVLGPDAQQAYETKQDLEQELAHLRQRKTVVTDIEERNANALAVTNAAKAAHERVCKWVELGELFSPHGLPKRLIAKVLQPMNERLTLSHHMTGWPQVVITEDMQILVGTRPHYLLSASEQWRADAQITEAIAFLSGIKLLFLDNFDILDHNGRSQCVKWALALAQEETQVFLFGTLKQKYEIAGVQGIWLD